MILHTALQWLKPNISQISNPQKTPDILSSPGSYYTCRLEIFCWKLDVIPWHYTVFHDDVIKGKHFPRYWPFVRGIHRSPVNSPHKCRWRGALMFSLICAWIDDWVNSREAGDLRRHRVHYEVTVMCYGYIHYQRMVWFGTYWLFLSLRLTSRTLRQSVTVTDMVRQRLWFPSGKRCITKEKAAGHICVFWLMVMRTRNRAGLHMSSKVATLRVQKVLPSPSQYWPDVSVKFKNQSVLAFDT